MEDVTFGDRSPFAGAGERNDIPFEIHDNPVSFQEGVQFPNLLPVPFIPDRLQGSKKGLHLLDPAARHPVDADVDDSFAVGVVDLLLRQGGVQETHPQLEADRRSDSDQARRLVHLLGRRDRVMIDRSDDPQARLPCRKRGGGRLIGTERVGGMNVVVHLEGGSVCKHPFPDCFPQYRCGGKANRLVRIVDLDLGIGNCHPRPPRCWCGRSGCRYSSASPRSSAAP